MPGPTLAIREQCPNATENNDGLMSAADKAKLDSLTPVGAGVTSVSAGTGITCTPDPIVATGTVALADTAVVPGSFTNANITVDQQGRITAASNGAAQDIANYFTVGTSGDVDFNTIEDAITAAVAGGAGPGNSYMIDVYPGFYVENPMTLPSGVIVRGYYDGSQSTVIIFALNPNADLFTINGGTIDGATLMGVSDPLKCLAKIQGMPGNPIGTLNNVQCTACSNAVIVDGSTSPSILLTSGSLQIAAFAPGLEVGIGVKCIGPFCQGDIFNLSLAVSPTAPYVINPIQTGVQLLAGAQLGIATMLSDVSYVDNTQVLVDVNDGSSAIIRNPFCVGSNIVFQIGASGSNSILNVLAGYLVSNATNFNLLSATGIAFVFTVVDAKNSFITPGATLSGIIQNLAALATDLAGTSAVEYGSERQASLPDFVHSLQKSGLRTGGDVTDPDGLGNPGLDITVSAGTGWIVRDTPIDVENVAWSQATLTLPASQSNVYIYIDDTTFLPSFSTTVPSASKILLAIVVTNTQIQYIHTAKVLAEDIGTNLQDYLLATQKLVLILGLAAVAGSTVRKFTIDSGSYYRALVPISFAGVADAVFNYFYGTNGATEVTAQTQVDITNYDNAGVLTPMTAGWFRADSVYITSDGQVSVIYGDEQYLTQNQAATEQIASPMSFISETAFSIATLVVEEGNGIVQIVDQRTVVARAGAASITVHGQLSGLAADDHPQYLLASGGRAMGGNLDMDGNQINNVLDVNGVVVEGHHVRHQPGGIDAIPTGVPVTPLIGTANAEGTAATLARSDHQHGMTSGTPQTIGTGNSEGASSSPARMDHVHAHGAQTDGTLHALAIASGAAGFLSGTDKAKIDGITPGAAVASVSGTAPIVSSGGTTPAISITAATTLVAGSMSAADKTKLDGLPASAVPTSRTLTAGNGLTGGGDLSANRTFTIGANADGSITVNPSDIQVGVLATDAQHGNRGGGNLHANVVAAGASGFMSGADKTKLDGLTPGAAVASVSGTAPIVSSGGTTPAISITAATTLAAGSMSAADKTKLNGLPTSAVPTSRTLTAGNGLTGGGDLSADRTFTVGANADGSITVNPTDIQVGILATDAQHGNRGGGALHANVVASGAAGFMSGTDKTKLDGIATSATNTPLSSSAPANVTKAAAAVGVGTTAARSDHKHDISTAAAVATSNANAEGSATSLARSDHTHQTQVETQSATATGAITTSSAVDVAMTGMSVTPGAGNWMAWFTTDVSNGNASQTITVSIYANGVQVAASQVVVSSTAINARHSVACLALISGLGGGQAVTVQWHTSGNTATANNRTLVLTRTQ